MNGQENQDPDPNKVCSDQLTGLNPKDPDPRLVLNTSKNFDHDFMHSLKVVTVAQDLCLERPCLITPLLKAFDFINSHLNFKQLFKVLILLRQNMVCL
jgi:hypothetical protein